MKTFRRVGLVVVLVAVVALVWPARWGGLFGFTVVAGDSMEPGMSSGDLAVTMRQSSYEVGDVVPFEVPGLDQRYVIHRIDSIADDGTITTKGDNRDTADHYQLRAEDALGKRILTIPRCDSGICRNLGWPLLAMILLLGTASGLWVYAVLAGRGGRPVVPEDPEDLHTPSGVAYQRVVRSADSQGHLHFVELEPVLDLYTAEVAGIRVTAAGGTGPVAAPLLVVQASQAILRSLSAAGEAATTVTAVLDDLLRPDWRELMEQLAACADSLGEEIHRLDLQVSSAVLARDSVDTGAITAMGINLVLDTPRTGLLANGDALVERCIGRGAAKVILDPARTAELPANPARRGPSRGVARSSLAGLEIVALGVERADQLNTLHSHGIERWSGPLGSG